MAYLISCFTPVVSPIDFTLFTFLALGFPYLALAVVLLLLVWLFVKKRISVWLIVLLCCGYTNFSNTLATNFFTNNEVAKEATALRVMGWNVRNFDNPADHANHPGSVRNRMFDYIKQVDADVLCLQEMVEYVGPSFLSNIGRLQQMGYKYFYKPSEVDTRYQFGLLQASNAIFSKIPILDSGNVILDDPSHPKKIIFADVELQGKRVRVFSCHFRSYYFSALPQPLPILFHGDSAFVNRASNLEKLLAIDKEHAKEAQIARKFIEASPYPVVFGTDMNAVPSSNTYKVARGQLQDAFLKRGSGLGGSLDSMPKTLRIDYLFADKRLRITSYRQRRLSLSDHYPHFMDVKWQE